MATWPAHLSLLDLITLCSVNGTHYEIPHCGAFLQKIYFIIFALIDIETWKYSLHMEVARVVEAYSIQGGVLLIQKGHPPTLLTWSYGSLWSFSALHITQQNLTSRKSYLIQPRKRISYVPVHFKYKTPICSTNYVNHLHNLTRTK